ncbi:MAG TPA: carboxypeptidase-like regulatory domain-containing protein, partial [Chthoniobacterales bacterium]|nr:carboxypeptidase-like regulatory domain-containing protein [Chthoniobacterales bacterium]
KSVNYLVLAWLFLSCVGWTRPANAAQPGFLEGHLKIILSREVDLADSPPGPITAGTYVQYPLIVLSQDRKREVARVTADKNGNYRVELPAGDYVLDVQRRPRIRVRAMPQPFTVTSGQTVHLDMDLDMGIR